MSKYIPTYTHKTKLVCIRSRPTCHVTGTHDSYNANFAVYRIAQLYRHISSQPAARSQTGTLRCIATNIRNPWKNYM